MLLRSADVLAKSFAKKSSTPKKLAIIFAGDNPASQLYVGIKAAKGEQYGVNVVIDRLASEVSTQVVLTAVQQRNRDRHTDAIIVQLPLPESVNTDAVLDGIDPTKDVDNLSGKSVFVSPMVQAVKAMLQTYSITLTGKKICVVGYGRLIGYPMTAWLESRGLSPDVIADPKQFSADRVRQADVVIAGTGQPRLITKGCVHSRQIVFDCSGVDVDFEAVKDRVAAITPPKGGIGPLTVHFLFQNVVGEKS